MAGSYIADRPEKPALVEADALLVGDSTVTGAGSGKKHHPKQSATPSSVALRTTSGTLKAAAGVASDDVVNVSQQALLNNKQTRLARALAKDPSAGDGSLLLDYTSQGFGSGDDYGINQAESFSERHTISRATVKNVFNARGELVQVAANQPAFNYDPFTGEPKGILIEPEPRTNLVRQSNKISVSPWNSGGPTVIPNFIPAPFGFSGSADAMVLTEGESSGVSQSVTVEAGSEYTVSFWAY